MKRYVKEYANDKIGYLQQSLVTSTNKPAIKEAILKINRIVKFCERGMITDHEAIAAITNTL